MIDSPFDTERNRDIYIDRLYNGMKYKDISDKYGISRERCRQIYLKYKRYVDQGVIEAPCKDERPQGEWIIKDDVYCICSECDNKEIKFSNYCPKCGAYMRGDK